MSAALDLAAALEEGRVQRVHVTTQTPDRLFDALVAAGARVEHPMRDKMELDRGGRLRWRQGSVIAHGAVVLITTEMSPVQRDPYVDAIAAVDAAPGVHVDPETSGEGG